MTITKENFLETIWYSGENALKECQKNMQPSQICIACDIPLETGISKAYALYPNTMTFWKNAKTLPERFFYVVIPADTKCSLFSDLEWDTTWKTVEEIKDKYISLVSEILSEQNILLKRDDYLFCNASSGTKGSLHVHVPKVYFDSITEQQNFFNVVYNLIHMNNDWVFLETTEKSYIQKTFIDFGVYNKNRMIRLPYSSKMKDGGIGVRPLIPEDEEFFRISQWTIIDVHDFQHKVNTEKFPSDRQCAKRSVYSRELIDKICDHHKLEVTLDTLKNGTLMPLKNKTKSRKCFITGETHSSNNSFITINGNNLNYHCHSERCKGQSKLLHSFEETKENLLSDPPFKKWVYDFCTRQKKEYFYTTGDKGNIIINHKNLNNWTKLFVTDINKYCVVIDMGAIPYTLSRYVETTDMGDKSVKWYPKKFDAFVLSFSNCKIKIGTTVKKLADLWINDIGRKTYRKESFNAMPNYNDPNSFNTWPGMAITHEKAIEKSKDRDIEPFLNFIKNVWCNNDEKLYVWVVSWFSHLLQKPWERMKTCIVLQSNEGSGKGSIVNKFQQILGETLFFQPGSEDEVFGNFNFLLDNKKLVFFDELSWGGSKKDAGKLKKLITEERRVSNAKFSPQRILENTMQIIIASNEEWVIPAGRKARRYTVLKLPDTMHQYSNEDKKKIWNACPYSVAKFFYNYNIDDFDPHTPYVTIGLRDQKIHTLSTIEKWLIDYVTVETNKFGFWMAKNDFYNSFKNESRCSYSSSNSFWIAIGKVFKFECKRKCINGNRIYKIYIPPRKELIESINTLYECELIEPDIDGELDTDGELEGEGEQSEDGNDTGMHFKHEEEKRDILD